MVPRYVPNTEVNALWGITTNFNTGNPFDHKRLKTQTIKRHAWCQVVEINSIQFIINEYFVLEAHVVTEKKLSNYATCNLYTYSVIFTHIGLIGTDINKDLLTYM